MKRYIQIVLILEWIGLCLLPSVGFAEVSSVFDSTNTATGRCMAMAISSKADLPGDSTVIRKKDPFLGIGLMGGLNAAGGYYDYKAGLTPPFPSLLLAPSAGFRLDFRFGRYFSVLSELAYRQKGDRIDMKKWYDLIEPAPTTGDWIPAVTTAEGNITTRVGYIELTLVPLIHASRFIHFGLGGYAAVGIHGSEKSDYQVTYSAEDWVFDRQEVVVQRFIEFADFVGIEDTESTRYFNRLDYGITGIIGFGHRPFTLDLGLSYGLATWQPTETLFSSTTTPNQTHHLVGVIALNFWFR